MTKRIDITIDKCVICNTTQTYVYTGVDANGDVFNNDLCLDCENSVYDMMDRTERISSLYRTVFKRTK